MTDPQFPERGVPRLLRTIGPVLVVIGTTIVALVVYLELVWMLLEVLPELAG